MVTEVVMKATFMLLAISAVMVFAPSLAADTIHDQLNGPEAGSPKAGFAMP
jgi:hypothetical protein